MPDAVRIKALAGASALLMLAVVAASAHIRASAGIDVGVSRGAHRIAASSVALLVMALLAVSWKREGLRAAAGGAFFLMLALSAVGWMGGTQPGPAAAVFNQSGGIALTALLAWIAGRASTAGGAPHAGLAAAALLLAALQACIGGLLSVLLAQPPVGALIAHAVAGVATAIAVGALGARYTACAIPAPLLGLASILLPAATAQAGHALAAALLLAAAAHAQGRAAAAHGRPKT